jgi:hypothetical protein
MKYDGGKDDYSHLIENPSQGLFYANEEITMYP